MKLGAKTHKRLARGMLLVSWLIALAGWLYGQAAFTITGGVLLNAFACALMGWDKRAAKKGAIRMPESSLFQIAALGGAAGICAGMFLFRHKTRHASFLLGVPALLMLQAFLLARFLRVP